MDLFCASFDIYENFVASGPLAETPTLRNQFLGRHPKGIDPNLRYFRMILEAVQAQLFEIKIHTSMLKIPNPPNSAYL